MKKLYSLMLGLVLLGFTVSVKAQVLEADSLALVDFYNATGANWSTTWCAEGVAVDNWDGIVVAEVDGVKRVTEFSTEGINNDGVYPSGTIPASIGNLSALTVLKLIGLETGPVILDLHGPMPAEIWNLTNLTKLQIKFTNLTGGIPDGIESMVNLAEINFQQTYLGGELPDELFQLPSLTKAYLHQSSFTGKVPETVTEATGLVRLYLQDNKLEAGLPFVELADPSNAKIELTGNYFTFADVQPYHDANASTPYKGLTDDYQYAQADQFEHFTEGEAVSFSIDITDAGVYNWFFNDETTPVTAGSNTHSIAAVSTDNVGTYTVKAQSSSVSNFEIISNFTITDVLASDITPLQQDSINLVDFYQASGGNWSTTWCVNDIDEWEGVVVAEVDGVNRVTELSTEGINNNGVYPSGTLSPSIGNLSALTVLKLIGLESGPVVMDLHGTIPSEIWNLTNLTKLQIKFTNLTGGIPDGIESMVNLSEINFQQTYLGGELPSELFQLPSLAKAYLHQSDFTGQVPSTLTEATGLVRLYLQDNHLEAGLPFVELADPSNAKIELTGNYFTFADVKTYHDANASTAYKGLTDDYQYAQATQVFSYTEGDAVDFTLNVPDADVYNWFFNDGTTPVTAGSNILSILSVLTSDVGVYTCKVQSAQVSNFEILADFVIKSVASVSTGIEVSDELESNVYPNPFKDQLTIQSGDELVTVSVYNLAGSLVFKQALSGTTETISLSGLQKGMYVFVIETASGNMIKKIIKQ